MNKFQSTEESTISKDKKQDIIIHKDIAIQKLNSLLCDYIKNPLTLEKADKLSYWIEDYCRFLEFEKAFKPQYLKKYNRGDVIKVNLGYNIGNEEGGLHYCIVLDKHNSMSSGIITVIPLTSNKGKALHFSEVSLGNEIFVNFSKKYDRLKLEISKQFNSILSSPKDNIELDKIETATENLKLLAKINDELAKMKKGSIALVSQITTISKQRIYDPQKTGDILSGLCISNNSLDLINEKIMQLYVKQVEHLNFTSQN